MQFNIIFILRSQQWLVMFSRVRCVLQPHGGATSIRIRIKRWCHQCCPHDITFYNLFIKYVVQRCCKGRWVSVPCYQRWIQQASVCLTPITPWLYRLKLKQVAVTGEKQEATHVVGSVVLVPPSHNVRTHMISVDLRKKSSAAFWLSSTNKAKLFPDPLWPPLLLFAVIIIIICYIYKMSYPSGTGKLSR